MTDKKLNFFFQSKNIEKIIKVTYTWIGHSVEQRGDHGRIVLVAIPASLQDIVKYTLIPLTHQTTNHEDV